MSKKAGLAIAIDKAILTNLNLGREGNGDNKPRRADLRISFTTDSTILEDLIGDERPHQEIYWLEDGTVIGQAEEVKLHGEFMHNDVKFGIFESMFPEDIEKFFFLPNCTIKGIKLVPMPNFVVKVDLTAQCRDMTPDLLWKTWEFQTYEGGLSITHNLEIAKRVQEELEKQDDLDIETEDPFYPYIVINTLTETEEQRVDAKNALDAAIRLGYEGSDFQEASDTASIIVNGTHTHTIKKAA